MIFHIKSLIQAESILRQLAAASPSYSFIVFDVEPGVPRDRVPLVLRRCQQQCANPGEYLGPNIWGAGPERRSIYCPNCGYAMRDLVTVNLAIQGATVLNTSYRTVTPEAAGLDPATGGGGKGSVVTNHDGNRSKLC